MKALHSQPYSHIATATSAYSITYELTAMRAGLKQVNTKNYLKKERMDYRTPPY